MQTSKPPGIPEHELAGGVVVRVDGGRVHVALIREGGPEYSLPKGHVGSGETLEQAARREVDEEAGLTGLRLLADLGVRERLDSTKSWWNKIHYFLFLSTDAVRGRAAWFPVEGLPPMYWPEQRALIETHRDAILRLLAAPPGHDSGSVKSAVRRQFDRQAGAYARSLSHARDEDLRLLVEQLRLGPDDRVLDVATGTGFTALAVRPHAGRVVGLDLTRRMLEEAKRISADAKIDWVEGDVESLPFRDGAFSVVTCRRAPHHFGEVEQAVQEMLRVLRPGGRLGIVDQIVPEREEGRRLIEELEVLRDPSHTRSLAAVEWETLLPVHGADVTFVRVVEARQSFAQWVDRAGTDSGGRQSIDAALARAPADVLAAIGYEAAPERTILKRWIVVVALKKQ